MLPTFDLQHTVTSDEIDGQGHVHNLRYLQWTLWAAGKHSAASGWNAKEGLARGFGWVVREHQVVYRAAAYQDDQIVIRTWVSEIGRFASRRRYMITRPKDKTVLSSVETRWVLVDFKTRKAIEIPKPLVDSMIVLDRPPAQPWER